MKRLVGRGSGLFRKRVDADQVTSESQYRNESQ